MLAHFHIVLHHVWIKEYILNELINSSSAFGNENGSI